MKPLKWSCHHEFVEETFIRIEFKSILGQPFRRSLTILKVLKSLSSLRESFNFYLLKSVLIRGKLIISLRNTTQFQAPESYTAVAYSESQKIVDSLDY